MQKKKKQNANCLNSKQQICLIVKLLSNYVFEFLDCLDSFCCCCCFFLLLCVGAGTFLQLRFGCRNLKDILRKNFQFVYWQFPSIASHFNDFAFFSLYFYLFFSYTCIIFSYIFYIHYENKYVVPPISLVCTFKCL